MDIAGAKALKDRLGPNGVDEAEPVRVDIPADAPPVYHWTGVSKLPSETTPSDMDETATTDGASLFRRLSLGFR